VKGRKREGETKRIERGRARKREGKQKRTQEKDMKSEGQRKRVCLYVYVGAGVIVHVYQPRRRVNARSASHSYM